jgi:hypothetical protein
MLLSMVLLISAVTVSVKCLLMLINVWFQGVTCGNTVYISIPHALHMFMVARRLLIYNDNGNI